MGVIMLLVTINLYGVHIDTTSLLHYLTDTARVFPAEPSWFTFKALLIPAERRTSLWEEEVCFPSLDL
jgi:hypothetical protein